VLDNLLVPLSGDWEGFSARAREFIADRDRVVALGTYSGTFRKSGRSFSAAFAHVWTVRGGTLARFDMHTDTAKVLEAMQDVPVDQAVS
jgi:ketosteroid isomerase-like protein